jgi:hypothetical protein
MLYKQLTSFCWVESCIERPRGASTRKIETRAFKDFRVGVDQWTDQMEADRVFMRLPLWGMDILVMMFPFFVRCSSRWRSSYYKVTDPLR